jgi:hypothetical protein
MLDDSEFRKLVGRMRDLQREFFSMRKTDPGRHEVLEESKRIEIQVDQELRECGLIDDGQREFPF